MTPAELARALFMAESEVGRALTRLEASGAIFRGHFTSASVEQWCDRYVLERIHRATLAKVRAEVEPCEDHEFAAFLARWHRLGATGPEAGKGELASVLDQLSGMAFAPQLWERAIIPARIAAYRPSISRLAVPFGPVRMGRVAAGGRDSRPARAGRAGEPS